jgi:FlaA1/EpsC-like NDP-sugar epimerase
MGYFLKIAGRHRFAAQAAIDSCAWLAALWLATFLRYELDGSLIVVGELLAIGAVAAVSQVVVGTLAGLYVHRWRYGTFEEITTTVKSVLVVTPIVVLVNLVWPLDHAVPTSAAISAGFIAVFLMFSVRFAWRFQLERWSLAVDVDRERVIVMGAGDGGLQIVSAMRRSGPFEPVAVLDDDPGHQNLRLKGVPVRGDRTSLAAVAEHTGATALVVAIPSASSEVIRDLAERADAAGLRVMVLPPVGELFGSGVGLSDIRPLTAADLLGRREINLDIESVAGYLTGKRVLVTGAGGSIGSELCRQIHRFAPESLVMLDRDESALQAVQLSIEGRSLLDSRDLVVGCIRDRARMEEVFREHRPDVVFHAAALKHLPLLEMYAEEGWKTNVWGTQNLLELADKFEVGRFVNISTDKAADPTSVLGHTKRLAEQLTAHASEKASGTFISVRFGNVLGSRGSVLPLFRSQIELGGPVTVTHPDVTRYFMTIPEACELVIQAGALQHDGQVLVLDMGEQVRIADLARQLIAESDSRVEIVYTGLREGEKLHEDLFAPDERPRISEHELISLVDVPAVSPEEAELADPFSGADVIDLRTTGTDHGEPLERSDRFLGRSS